MAKTKTQTRRTRRHKKTRGGYNANEPGSITSPLKNTNRKTTNSKSKSYKDKNIKNKK